MSGLVVVARIWEMVAAVTAASVSAQLSWNGMNRLLSAP